MLEIGSVLDGKYKILSEIGHGGMSVVYMALNEKANKTWAVKEVRKNGRMDFNIVRQGLVAELETLKRLSHPNLPSIVDVIEYDDSFIIVMDYIEGRSLDKVLAEDGIPSQDDVVDWAIQLCDVFNYLHSCRPPIIYRDMKPANVMLKPDGNIALIDFGTAKTYEDNSGDTSGIGTRGYAAPEQYVGSGFGRTDARTDIYCLGITLYQLLTGVNPSEQVIINRSIRAVNPYLSSGLDAIIQKCTEQDPNLRYQNCAELMYALMNYEDQDDEHRKAQKRKLALFSGTSAAALVMALVSLFSFIMNGRQTKDQYNSFLTKAKNQTDASVEERIKNYQEAMVIDPTKVDAYLELIDFLTSEDSGETDLTAAEDSIIRKMTIGVPSKDSRGYTEEINVMQRLERSNREGYKEVCQKIGEAYVYRYEKEDVRYILARDWFLVTKEDEEKYPIAKVYYNIGENQKKIDELKGRESIIEEAEVYASLLANLKLLYSNATPQKIRGEDVRLLVFGEIVRNIDYYVEQFLNRATPDELLTLLEQIKDDTNTIKSTTKYTTTIPQADALLKSIETAESRVGSAEKMRNTGGGVS